MKPEMATKIHLREAEKHLNLALLSAQEDRDSCTIYELQWVLPQVTLLRIRLGIEED